MLLKSFAMNPKLPTPLCQIITKFPIYRIIFTIMIYISSTSHSNVHFPPFALFKFNNISFSANTYCCFLIDGMFPNLDFPFKPISPNHALRQTLCELIFYNLFTNYSNSYCVDLAFYALSLFRISALLTKYDCKALSFDRI